MIVFNATFLVTPGQEKPVEKILLAHAEEAKETNSSSAASKKDLWRRKRG